MGSRAWGIENYVAPTHPWCSPMVVDPRHARRYPRAGEKVEQRQLLLHAISRTLKWLGVPDHKRRERSLSLNTSA